MTRAVLALALLTGCASQAPTVRALGEDARTVGTTVSAPSPVPVVRERRMPRASRSRSSALLPGTGSPLNWAALRQCESSNNYTDRDSPIYFGAYQFDLQTWHSVGGTGNPADAPPAEQDMRAQLLYNARGRQPWPVCGRWL